MKNMKMMLFACFLLLGVSAISALAQDNMMKDDHMGKMTAKTPTVAIIRADWCSACKEVEPILNEVMQGYGDKLNFVVLDVSNEETTAKAAATAKSLGLTSFFEANKKNTSTVGVFSKNKKQLFKTTHNPDRAVYVAAIDKAIKS